MPPTVTILTPIPSPYQVELFDALTARQRFRVRVLYLVREHGSRNWKLPNLLHEHIYCEDERGASGTAERWTDDSDLVVFSWYGDRHSRGLLRRRAASGRPWCFWGERPGFGGWKLLGRFRRRLLLGPLLRCQVPIWGIGQWAVEGWQREFGRHRDYRNIPYFSDLTRFTRTANWIRPAGRRRVLFSGSLIPRKGVDLLGEAFARVAPAFPQLHLDLVGTGILEANLREQLARFGDQVRFLGFRQWPDLPAIYHEADVLCSPSRYDGWGLIVPEGLAAGLPVIATDRTGAAIDLLRPGENGWRVRAGNLGDLVQVLHQVANLTDEELDALSQAAIRSVAAHSLDQGVSRFCDAVAGALAGALAVNSRAPGLPAVP